MTHFKLTKIPRSQRLRKALKLLTEGERCFCKTGKWNSEEMLGILRIIASDFPEGSFPPESSNISGIIQEEDLRRAVNAARHFLLAETGQAPADWDFLDPENKLDASKRTVFKGVCVYLEDLRSPFNVGSIFRIAEAFGVEKIYLSPYAADPRHKRAERTAMGCVDAVAWARDEPPWDQVFAMETGGVSVQDFVFPKSGVLVAGSEELGVSPEVLARADASLGRVSIPLLGAKGSLNVAAAFAIVMNAWAASLSQPPINPLTTPHQPPINSDSCRSGACPDPTTSIMLFIDKD